MSNGLDVIRAAGDRFLNSLTLVDLQGHDQPLVYVNRAFCELTGYAQGEILGRNCRFLQGPETARADVDRVRAAIASGTAVFCDLLNYRKDGSTFFNRLVLLPIELDDRPHFIGMQIDSTALVAKGLAAGRSFDDMKTSEAIRDRINTPLMKIMTALSELEPSEGQRRILERAFGQILATVRELPFRG